MTLPIWESKLIQITQAGFQIDQERSLIGRHHLRLDLIGREQPLVSIILKTPLRLSKSWKLQPRRRNYFCEIDILHLPYPHSSAFRFNIGSSQPYVQGQIVFQSYF